MDCRKHDIRKGLVKVFDINPIAHVKLLNGQEKKSCTGVILTDSYYCFSYKKKGSKDKLKSFFCGAHASKDFIELIGCEPIPLFNPIHSISNRGNGGNRGSIPKQKWNPLAKELSDAINILIVYWNITPAGAILDIKTKVDKYYYKEPFDSQIKGVNTIISRDKKNLSLLGMLQELNIDGNLKEFTFPLINRKLDELDITSQYV